MRRLILVLSTIVFNNYAFAQIIIFIFLSELNLIHLIFYKPYIEKYNNRLEIFNEFCIIIMGYQLVMFTDFVDDENTKYYSGYTLIGIIGLNFLFNFLL